MAWIIFGMNLGIFPVKEETENAVRCFFNAIQCFYRSRAYFSEYVWIQVTGASFSVLSSKPFSAQAAPNLLLDLVFVHGHVPAAVSLLGSCFFADLFVSAEFLFTALFVTHVYICMHAHTLFCIQINPIRPRYFPHAGRAHGTVQLSGCCGLRVAQSPGNWFAPILAITKQRGPSILFPQAECKIIIMPRNFS